MGLQSVPNMLGKETNNFLILWSANRRKLINFLIVLLPPDSRSTGVAAAINLSSAITNSVVREGVALMSAVPSDLTQCSFLSL